MMNGWLGECEMNELRFVMNIGHQEGIPCNMGSTISVRYGERMNKLRDVINIQASINIFIITCSFLNK